MHGPTLTVCNLAVARGDRTLFSGLSFSLAPGEALHVQGRNGCGKTTLLETLSGLRQPEAGQIEPRPAPEKFHWIGHRNALNPVLSPMENLSFWCGVHAAAPESIPDALRAAGLHKSAHRPCGQLSTGQKRRAALARLKLQRRDWWLLDEPLAGLDDEGCALLAHWLSDHLRTGGSAVFSSHQVLAQATRSLQLA